VLTLKLTKRGTKAAAAASATAAEQVLSPKFDGFRVVHLLGNTSQERTVVAVRCPDREPV
jgi:hypothetical protein